MPQPQAVLDDVQAAVETAMEKLGALGSADAIAAFLAGEGIRGARGFAASCPLSVYLCRMTGKPVVVGEYTWSVLDVDGLACGDNPGAVIRFIEAFDDFMRYPELVHGEA